MDFGGTLGPRFNVELPSMHSRPRRGPVHAELKRAGILDDVVFFITTDPDDDPNGLHPFLAQGIRRGNAFEVTRLADDVEDMQIAYGIDTDGDTTVTRQTAGGCCPIPPDDPDPNVLDDGRLRRVDAERGRRGGPPRRYEFQQQNPFNPSHSGTPLAIHCPRLHAVMISLLAKAHDSDPTYKGPAAPGLQAHELHGDPDHAGQLTAAASRR